MGQITENFMFKYMYERYMRNQQTKTEEEVKTEAPKALDTIPEEPTWGSKKNRENLGDVPK